MIDFYLEMVFSEEQVYIDKLSSVLKSDSSLKEIDCAKVFKEVLYEYIEDK